jgi:hypothetical protein
MPTVADRIGVLLQRRPTLAYCTACLGEELGLLDEGIVRHAVQRLLKNPEYTARRDVCAVCRREENTVGLVPT